MIKNHSKHFRSTGAFFNNSTIILKLIWPEKTNLLYFEISYFQKQNNFFPNNVGRHARCIQPRWQNSLYRLSMKIRGYPWATRVDTDSFVSEFPSWNAVTKLVHQNVRLFVQKWHWRPHAQFLLSWYLCTVVLAVTITPHYLENTTVMHISIGLLDRTL